MSIDMPLDEMTLADKLEVMEKLWADISKQPNELPSPDWHQEVLEERRRSVEGGKVSFLDWDTVISELKDELHENTLS